MSDSIAVSIALAADPRNVGTARHVLRDAMMCTGATDLIDSATLLLSEVVTNAFVHAGTEVVVKVHASAVALRVEVHDGAAHLPLRRDYSGSAGTGRGVQLLDDLANRWGASPRADGKTVWFEMGDFVSEGAGDQVADRTGVDNDVTKSDEGSEAIEPRPVTPSVAICEVTLRHVPLLMHRAWQEHAATLLREYLLHVLEDDDDILDKHAQASEAITLLAEQLPDLPSSAKIAEIMTGAVEPAVTAEEVVLRLPRASIKHFEVLDRLLTSATEAARAGHFLSPPTQPEIEEMRAWFCSEVASQAGGAVTATPWVSRTDVRATLADQRTLLRTYSTLSNVEEPLLATDEASIIVAASRSALAILGYRRAEELLGRRVIAVVPARFHQAHIAGTTLHATSGRDNLVGVPIEVPMVRADGMEVTVHLEVRGERLDASRRIFLARFQLA